MEKKFLQMLQIEENLKKSFDLNYFVLFNTTSACIIEKYNELLFYHMLDEECDLHLKDVSLFQINQYLKLLENEFVANKTSFLFEDISVYSFHLVPKVRLYSQLKKEKMRKLKKRLLDINQQEFYYEELFRARLLEQFYEFHLKNCQSDENYARIFYQLLYSFVGLEESYDCDIHLESWFLNSFLFEDYLAYEKQILLKFFQQSLEMLNSMSFHKLQEFLNTVSLSFFFASIVTFLLKIEENEAIETMVFHLVTQNADIVWNFVVKIEGKYLKLVK